MPVSSIPWVDYSWFIVISYHFLQSYSYQRLSSVILGEERNRHGTSGSPIQSVYGVQSLPHALPGIVKGPCHKENPQGLPKDRLSHSRTEIKRGDQPQCPLTLKDKPWVYTEAVNSKLFLSHVWANSWTKHMLNWLKQKPKVSGPCPNLHVHTIWGAKLFLS